MRTTITMPDAVFKRGLYLARQRGFSQSFSAYLAWLVERDAAGEVQQKVIDLNVTRYRVAEEPPEGGKLKD